MAAYATAAEYRDRMGLSSADNDDTILEQLEAISRVLDRKLHIFAGDLAPTETATRLFVLERPGKKLWLRDDAGHAHFLRSVSVSPSMATRWRRRTSDCGRSIKR